jgi:hypothetical protein
VNHKPLAIDLEFVALGLAAEDCMIVEHQAGGVALALALEEQRRGESADPAADDHTVKHFARIRGISSALVHAIANVVTGGHDLVGVAVRSGVIPDAAVARPVFLREQLERRGPM